MGKVIIEQVVSVDGYAEDAGGGIDFIVDARWETEVDAEQLRMLSGVSAIILGATTYRMFAEYWPYVDPTSEPVATPLRELPKFVVSSTLESAPWGESEMVEILRGDGVAGVRSLRQRFNGDLIVWGSLSLSDALLSAGEVDVLRLRVLPELLGGGRSFFPSMPGIRRLSLKKAQAFAGGLVLLEYHATHDRSSSIT